MSLLALRDVEKIERFYLSSCTELTPMIAKSMHRSFPALNINLNINSHNSQPVFNFSRISRKQSRKEVNISGPESEGTLTNKNNSRAKRAFLRMCDSLGSSENKEPEPEPSCSQQLEPPQLTDESMVEIEENIQLLMATPSITKAEFLKRMEDGMYRKKPIDKEDVNDHPIDHHHQYAKSEYVLSKPTKDPDNVMTSEQNQTKSTSAIVDDKSTTEAASDTNNNGQVVPSPPERSAASKVIFTGFLLFFLLGLVKSAQQNK